MDRVEEVQKVAKDLVWDESLGSDNYYKQNEQEFVERRNKIIADIKKKKQDKFLKAFNLYERVINNAVKLKQAVEIMNRRVTDPSFLKSTDYNANAWKDIGTRPLWDVEAAFKDYVLVCTQATKEKNQECNNMGTFIQTAAIGISTFNRIKNLESTVNSLVLTVNALIEQLQCNARMSPDEVAKVNKKVAQRYNNGYIPTDKWYGLSNFQNFQASFHFKDFCQNPPRAWWNSFSEDEKMKVIYKKQDWQKKD